MLLPAPPLSSNIKEAYYPHCDTCGAQIATTEQYKARTPGESIWCQFLGYADSGPTGFLMCAACFGRGMTREEAVAFGQAFTAARYGATIAPAGAAFYRTDQPKEKAKNAKPKLHGEFEECSTHAVPCPSWGTHAPFTSHWGDICCFYCCELCKNFCEDPITHQRKVKS